MAVVLNGIVENFVELKERLLDAGHTFTSETDAEVVVHLVETHYTGDLAAAVQQTYAALEGHFAFVVIHRAHPGLLVGARLQCPLVVERANGEAFLASSIAAFQRESQRVQLIEDGEIVAITPEGCALPRRGRRARPRGVRRRLGRRAGREARLRELHAEGDLRAAERGRTTTRRRGPERPRARLSASPSSRSRTSAGWSCSPAAPRTTRGGRALRDRGVGPSPMRARRRERVALPASGADPRHARDRDHPVRRDGRHAGRHAAGTGDGRAHGGDHEPARHADHARGRSRPVHARRNGDGRRGVEDVHLPGRALFLVALKLAEVRKTLPPEEIARCSTRCAAGSHRGLSRRRPSDRGDRAGALREAVLPLPRSPHRAAGLPRRCAEAQGDLYIPTEAYSAGR